MLSVSVYNYNNAISFGRKKQAVSPHDKINYIAAGGTINTDSKNGTRVASADILKSMLNRFNGDVGRRDIPFTSPIDSSYYTPELQARLGGVVSNALCEKAKCAIKSNIKSQEWVSLGKLPFWFDFKKPVKVAGAVITHGTDTLEENSSLLAYEKLNSPVVYTASWAGPLEKGSDAIQNVSKAEKLAVHFNTPPGTFIVIGDTIHLATRCHKVNTKPWQQDGKPMSYFASLDGKPVGKFDKEGNVLFRTEFLEEWVKIHSQNPLKKYNIDLRKGFKPAYVEHVVVDKHTTLQTFKDLKKRLEEAAKKAPAGVIIEGDLPNNAKVRDIINELNKNGRIVVANSREFKGLYPIQARIKMATLLGMKEIPVKDIKKLMATNIAGEIVDKFGIERTQWELPRAFTQKGEFLITYPCIEKHAIDDAVDRLLGKTSEERILLINGYGDGHMPIGAMSMKQRIEKGFQAIGMPELAQKLIARIEKAAPQKAEANYSMDNVVANLTQLSKNKDSSKAKALLRKAFMTTNGLLESIGRAVEKGVKVRIGSKADFATPNLHAYEIGTILELIGAKSTKMPTHKYLLRFVK